MKGSLLVFSVAATMAMASLSIPAAAQNHKVSPGAPRAKEVRVGYGLDKTSPLPGQIRMEPAFPLKSLPPRPSQLPKKRLLPT